MLPAYIIMCKENTTFQQNQHMIRRRKMEENIKLNEEQLEQVDGGAAEARGGWRAVKCVVAKNYLALRTQPDFKRAHRSGPAQFSVQIPIRRAASMFGLLMQEKKAG